MYSEAPQQLTIPSVLQQHRDALSALIESRISLHTRPSATFQALRDLEELLLKEFEALAVAPSPHEHRDLVGDGQNVASVLHRCVRITEIDFETSASPSAWLGLDDLDADSLCMVVHALCLTEVHFAQQWLTEVARSVPSTRVSAVALLVLAVHRNSVSIKIESTAATNREIAWLLAQAGGRMPGAWSAKHLSEYLSHSSAQVREAALRASARCGLRESLAYCREAAARLEPTEAIEFLGVLGSVEDLSRLQRAASIPVVANAAVNGLGRLGLPACVPVLLELMESETLVESAAAAFWRITGQEVPRDPAPEPPTDLTEDELDLWEAKPPVDLAGARDWWKANAARFDPEKRYQTGLNVSDDPLGPVFDQLPLAVRYDVYLRERALTPGTPDWELETWTWKQRNPGWRGNLNSAASGETSR